MNTNTVYRRFQSDVYMTLLIALHFNFYYKKVGWALLQDFFVELRAFFH
jgi:hypothetical protein